MSTTSKRERSSNFSREEIELLTSLVAEHKNILENKKSDAVTWHEKEQCWKTLEALFNSASGVNFRSAKTLKAKYEGIKRATRKKSAEIRAEIYRTGGGPSAAPPLTPIEEKVKDMILLTVDGIQSQFDSDHVDTILLSQESAAIINNPQNIEFINSDIVVESVEADVQHFKHHIIVDQPTQKEDSDDERPPKRKIIVDQPTQKEDSDDERPPKRKISECATPKLSGDDKWTNWKPKSLRSKKHPALSATKMKRPFERVADSKLEIADLQKKILEEELLNKRLQWAFEEEERQHKRELWLLEKNTF